MARFATDTANDHSATLWIATILPILYTTFTSVVRIYAKRITFGLDDALFFVAQLLSYGEYAAIVVGLNHGMGRSLQLLHEAQKTTTLRVRLRDDTDSSHCCAQYC